MAAFPKHVDEIRKKVRIGVDSMSHTAEIEDSRAFRALGIDNSFKLEEFQRNVKIDILELDEERIVFDLIGVSAPIANALRRILIAEVPTMAIDRINLYQNTSIIQDEVLVHRIGLIPIRADPRVFSYVKDHPEEKRTSSNTLVFTLKIACSEKSDGSLINGEVYSGDLKWVPQGNQETQFGTDGVGIVNPNILIAKLRPGQEIEAELFVEKGIGKEHAKWSPVCTASYRLLPDVEITTEQGIKGERAERLKNLCPMGVFDIEDGKAVVGNSRQCTACRECIRTPEFSDDIQLGRIRDHFIFTVESVGAYKPEELIPEALSVFTDKCSKLLSELASTSS